jgi:pimeloyl-ACP methyl ester carboxylesterase
MQVIVDSLLTVYEKAGTGPTILLLHGWGDTHTTFGALTRDLATSYTIILLDLPGFGGSQAPSEAWGLDDFADFVSKFLAKIDSQDVFAVVGHSNGGAIAIRGLATKKWATKKLVLLASAGIRDVYKGRKKALRLAAKAAKAATYPLPKSLQTKLKKGAYRTIGSDLFVAEHLQETFKRIVTADVQKDAANLKLPTLIVYGAKDTATPPAYGERYHRAIAGSRFEVLEGVGHFVHHDEPAKVSALIREFLNGPH